MPEPASPTVRRRLLAAELRRLREHAGMTGDEVATSLGWSASKVSRIENAHTAPRVSEIKKLLALYRVDATATEELLQLAREAVGKGWWENYSQSLPREYTTLIGMEADARSVFSWAPMVVPGLLQTDDYARQVTNGYLEKIAPVPPAETRRRVEVRLARQQVLTRDNPLQLSVVLDESVLHRRFGNKAVMYSQVRQLHKLSSERANITLRILPFDGPHPIGTGAFVFLKFGEVHDTTYQDVVYLEDLASGRYVENEDETYRYQRTFDRLFDLALDERQTLLALEAACDRWK